MISAYENDPEKIRNMLMITENDDNLKPAMCALANIVSDQQRRIKELENKLDRK